MSDREWDHNQEWEELLKRAVIGHYADSAADVNYNPNSWHTMKEKLDRQRANEKRKYGAQSWGIAIASSLLFIFVFAGPAQMESVHPFTRMILDVKQDVVVYLEKFERNEKHQINSVKGKAHKCMSLGK